MNCQNRRKCQKIQIEKLRTPTSWRVQGSLFSAIFGNFAISGNLPHPKSTL
jgi:hypothetical protein